jgi:hypothetical protein
VVESFIPGKNKKQRKEEKKVAKSEEVKEVEKEVGSGHAKHPIFRATLLIFSQFYGLYECFSGVNNSRRQPGSDLDMLLIYKKNIAKLPPNIRLRTAILTMR